MRKPMVTRTITTTTYSVMCLDVSTATVSTVDFTLNGEQVATDKALKALKAEMETDTLKVVHIESATETTKLYGMSEQDFIRHAHILPNR